MILIHLCIGLQSTDATGQMICYTFVIWETKVDVLQIIFVMHWPDSISEVWYTVWPEILAGRYFGGLLKICHLAEFTLAVEPVLAIMIFIAKWLIKRSGNLTWL